MENYIRSKVNAPKEFLDLFLKIENDDYDEEKINISLSTLADYIDVKESELTKLIEQYSKKSNYVIKSTNSNNVIWINHKCIRYLCKKIKSKISRDVVSNIARIAYLSSDYNKLNEYPKQDLNSTKEEKAGHEIPDITLIPFNISRPFPKTYPIGYEDVEKMLEMDEKKIELAITSNQCISIIVVY